MPPESADDLIISMSSCYCTITDFLTYYIVSWLDLAEFELGYCRCCLDVREATDVFRGRLACYYGYWVRKVASPLRTA